MIKRLFFVVFVFLMLGYFINTHNVQPIAASPLADCDSFDTDDPFFTPVTINFTCATAQTAFFGICDSGPALDDYFELVYNSTVVASNDISGSDEIVTIGSAMTSAGANTATLNRTAGLGTATYSYGISTDRIAVEAYLNANCGGDYNPTAPLGTCSGTVPVFTEDQAPADGTLELHVLFGNEGARTDELIMMSWDIAAGQQINNATVNNLPPRYARVWWQPDGSSDWYMLTSQYWSNSGDLTSEYGIGCSGGQASYHTSFASAVPESDVCFDLENGCTP